jgi:hypothetical protein
MRAALKKTTSRSSFWVNWSIFFRVAGIEDRSERSRRSVETLAVGLAVETKAASSVVRRCSLRARRITWLKPWEANSAETWFPMPGPEPKTTIVRVGAMVV